MSAGFVSLGVWLCGLRFVFVAFWGSLFCSALGWAFGLGLRCPPRGRWGLVGFCAGFAVSAGGFVGLGGGFSWLGGLVALRLVVAFPGRAACLFGLASLGLLLFCGPGGFVPSRSWLGAVVAFGWRCRFRLLLLLLLLWLGPGHPLPVFWCVGLARLLWFRFFWGRFVAASLVGFTGARSLGAPWSPLVASVVGSVLAGGRGVAVGCASGADLLVRSAAPGALVFSVASGRWGRGRGAFAGRSAALVRAVAASGPGAGAGFVGFVSSACPAGVVPAGSWRSGVPASGSWSTLALAAGAGLPVVVFWCGPWPGPGGSPPLPAWPGGAWSPAAASGCWAAGWLWSPGLG